MTTPSSSTFPPAKPLPADAAGAGAADTPSTTSPDPANPAASAAERSTASPATAPGSETALQREQRAARERTGPNDDDKDGAPEHLDSPAESLGKAIVAPVTDTARTGPPTGRDGDPTTRRG